jgi:hypothetical protein
MIHEQHVWHFLFEAVSVQAFNQVGVWCSLCVSVVAGVVLSGPHLATFISIEHIYVLTGNGNNAICIFAVIN